MGVGVEDIAKFSLLFFRPLRETRVNAATIRLLALEGLFIENMFTDINEAVVKNSSEQPKRFRITVTSEGGDSKEQMKSKFKSIKWSERELTMTEMYALALQGYSFANLYKFTKPFRSKYRKEKYLRGFQCIFIDVDGAKIDIDSLIALFQYNDVIKPSLYYTTFSNAVNNPRIRLVYVFDEVFNKKAFELLYYYYRTQLLKVYGDTISLDACSGVFNQSYFGTTAKDEYFRGAILSENPLITRDTIVRATDFFKELNNNILSSAQALSDNETKVSIDNVLLNWLSHFFGGSDKERHFDMIWESEHTTPYLTELPQEVSENDTPYPFDFSDPEIRRFMESNKMSDWWYNNGDKYKLYEDNWSSLKKDKATRAEVISVEPFRFWDSKKKQHYIRKFKDGEGRRKRLYSAAIKLRLINPDMDKWTFLYNLTNWFFTNIINNGNKIGWVDLMSIINRAMTDDVATYRKKRLELLGDKASKIVKSPYYVPIRKEDRLKKTEELLMSGASDDEVMDIVGIKERTLRTYKRELGIKTIKCPQPTKEALTEKINDIIDGEQECSTNPITHCVEDDITYSAKKEKKEKKEKKIDVKLRLFRQLVDEGKTRTEIMSTMKISRPTYFRLNNRIK